MCLETHLQAPSSYDDTVELHYPAAPAHDRYSLKDVAHIASLERLQP